MGQALNWMIITLLLLTVILFQARTITEYHAQVKEWHGLFAKQHAQTKEALMAWELCRAQMQNLRFP